MNSAEDVSMRQGACSRKNGGIGPGRGMVGNPPTIRAGSLCFDLEIVLQSPGSLAIFIDG
jgi:hypothetical protein